MSKKFIILLSLVLLNINLGAQPDFWTPHNLTIQLEELKKNSSGIFYGVTDTAIHKSSDYGLTWEVIYTTPEPCIEGQRLTLYSNKNYLPQDKLIIKQRNHSISCTYIPPVFSTDGGNTWNQINFPLSHPYGILDMAIDSDLDIYISARDSNLYRSSNNGVSWEIINDPSGLNERIGSLDSDSLNNIYITVRGRIYINYTWWFWEYGSKTTNGGQNWNGMFGTGWGPYESLSMFALPSGDAFGSDSWGSTFHHWNQTTNTYSIGYANSAFISSNRDIYISNNNGIHFTADNGNSWRTINSGLTNLRTTSIVSDTLSYIYTSTEDGIFKSNFSTIRLNNEPVIILDDTRIADTSYKNITVSNPFAFALNVDSITFHPSNIYLVGQSIQNIEPGDSTELEIGFTPHSFGNVDCEIIFYCEIINSKLYLRGNSPQPELIALESIGYGVTNLLEPKTDTLLITSESINSIIIDTVYLRQNLFFEIENLIFPLVIEQNDSLNVLVTFNADTVGVLRDTLIINSNAINNPFMVSLTGIVQNPNEVENYQDIITRYTLNQNFPNPFNPTTKIEYQIPELSFVTIKIYDVLGNEVTTLVKEEKVAGSYEVEFDGSELPSGIYFYQLKAGNFVETKKMVLMK